MREDAPSPSLLARRARELTLGWVEGDPPAAFYGFAVDLIYTGHPEIAWRFLDKAWPAGVTCWRAPCAPMSAALRRGPTSMRVLWPTRVARCWSTCWHGCR